MAKINWRAIQFITSLATIHDLQREAKGQKRPHFAFVGKSNVGKSSLINHLADNKKLAKISSTPGKTQLINLFDLKPAYLVDLPGYGFAQVSHQIRESWNLLIAQYFELFQSHLYLFILIDPKKKIGEEDFEMIHLCQIRQIPFTVIFTKIDQIAPTQLEKTIQPRLKELQSFLGQEANFVLHSKHQSKGKLAIMHLIESAFNQDLNP